MAALRYIDNFETDRNRRCVQPWMHVAVCSDYPGIMHPAVLWNGASVGQQAMIVTLTQFVVVATDIFEWINMVLLKRHDTF